MSKVQARIIPDALESEQNPSKAQFNLGCSWHLAIKSIRSASLIGIEDYMVWNNENVPCHVQLACSCAETPRLQHF